jgi:hypothetical protein
MMKQKTEGLHLPLPDTCSVLRLVKDSKGLPTTGVYKISCKCGAAYVRVMDHIMGDHIK